MKKISIWVCLLAVVASYWIGNEQGDAAGFQRGSVAGNEVGYVAGYEEGYKAGRIAGYDAGYAASKRDNSTSNPVIEAAQKNEPAIIAEAPNGGKLIALPEGSSKPSTPSEPEPVSVTVYITNTGEKYHRNGCQYLRQSKIAIELSVALSRGYDACSRCW